MKEYITKDKELTASRLKTAMRLADIKAVTLSRQTGLSKSVISQLVHGRLAPSTKTAEPLANVLKVNPVWLMGFDVPMHGWEAEDLAKRKVVSDAIRKQLRKTSKTVEDIAAALGITESTFKRWASGLELPNFVQITELAEVFNCKVSQLYEDRRAIPVMGQVQAGQPTLATQEVDDYIDVPDTMSDEHFALRIKGDSMSPRFQEGDIVIVRQQPALDKGDIGVFLIDDEATIKQFMPMGDLITLVALNPNYAPLVYQEITILGKVVELRARI